MILVAGYCRVSTDREDQANSFEAQKRYFREYADRNPDWELYEIYADEGITGTSTAKRTEFNRMIRDARIGKIKLILTKEVSRFSRNILDTISFTRELRALGVGVLFMNDGISTMEPDAELRLSIMGSIAQEESRKTSSRVKWGQTRQMERGVVFGTSMLGYDVKNGKMTVDPEGAEVIRLIFHKYGVEKKGTSVIARELREAGCKTYRGNTDWSNSQIVKILKNEKYVGDLIQKKTFTPDYLTHAKKYNHGEEEMITIRNHHEPIVSRALWDAVQTELKKRSRRRTPGVGCSCRYAFSGKILCGECGACFVSRSGRRKDGTAYRKWGCPAAAGKTDGRTSKNCEIGRMLRDEAAKEMLKQSLQSLPLDSERIIRNVAELAAEAIRHCGREDGERRLQNRINQITKKKEAALDAFLSGTVTKEELTHLCGKYSEQLAELQRRSRSVRQKEGDAAQTAEELRREVAAIIRFEAESEVFCKTILDRVTVFRDGRAELRLKNLPQRWVFSLGKPRASRQRSEAYQNDCDVPISVSTACSAGYGIEKRCER